MEKKYVVGVDLGGTKIYTALVDLEGNIIKEKTVETLANEGEQAVMGRIIAVSYTHLYWSRKSWIFLRKISKRK